MRQTMQPPRLLGVVHLRVGEDLVAVPVQSAPLARDESDRAAGGFFMEDSGQCGILVDSALPEHEARRQIDRAIVDAASQLSKRFLN